MNLPPQTIVRFKASNFLKLTAVEIIPKPGENVITIGGFNGAGKSSVLNGIETTFGGGKTAPEEPVREGEEVAVTLTETEDLIVTRRYTASGSTVVIKNKADAKIRYSSPQELLDALFGGPGVRSGGVPPHEGRKAAGNPAGSAGGSISMKSKRS